ncbi:MAG: type II toxin-antitoxin system prevent-host-death family antitoxin [Gammaproteobacteria bacterium]
MSSITANELKTKGVSVVEDALRSDDEAIITVRGKETYVVIDINKYSKFREYELEIALQEARADIAEGRVIRESVDDHMKRVLNK